MDTQLWIETLLLGVLEGLTEFIPVSSTGHLILVIDLIGFKGPEGKIFEIAIQLGAILAVCYAYKERLLHTAATLHKKSSQNFVLAVTLAFIPAVIIGFAAHSFIKSMLFNPWVVSVMLVVGGIIILLVERMKIEPKRHEIEKFSFKTSLLIGLAQCLAMIPGTSRSGATIIGALLLKVDRKAATEFSFFLAIPTMVGATALDIYKNYEHVNTESLSIIAVGFISAFITALFVVRKVVAFISTHGFTPFGYYRIVIGGVMLLLLSLQ